MDTNDIVDAVLRGDAEAFKSTFDQIVADKISDALEVRKIELASTLIATEEEPNDSEESFDGDIADDSESSSDSE